MLGLNPSQFWFWSVTREDFGLTSLNWNWICCVCKGMHVWVAKSWTCFTGRLRMYYEAVGWSAHTHSWDKKHKVVNVPHPCVIKMDQSRRQLQRDHGAGVPHPALRTWLSVLLLIGLCHYCVQVHLAPRCCLRFVSSLLQAFLIPVSAELAVQKSSWRASLKF